MHADRSRQVFTLYSCPPWHILSDVAQQQGSMHLHTLVGRKIRPRLVLLSNDQYTRDSRGRAATRFDAAVHYVCKRDAKLFAHGHSLRRLTYCVTLMVTSYP